jgi:hypothetical protein
MMKKMFFSQRLLGVLSDEGKIKLEGNVLTLLSRDRPAFELEPAFRIARTADNGPDPHGLVGTIRSEKALREMNAEIYLDSVIYRDTAYEAESGFIGEEKELMDKLADTELLARYLLENLM